MPKRIGKCTNYASCQLAFQNADIEPEGDFVCPECGQPLQDVKPVVARRKFQTSILLYGGIALAVLVIIILAVMIMLRSGEKPGKDSLARTRTPTPEMTHEESRDLESVTPTPTSAPTAPPIFSTSVEKEEDEGTPTPTATPTMTPTPAAEPVEELMPTVPDVFDRNPASEENAKTRGEVLKRVDLIPNLTDAERDKLYARVNEARVMLKVILIPFGYAQKKLSASAIEKLCDETRKPQIQELMQDPTVVFVVLGFADVYGTAASGLKLSTERAESVVDSLRKNCGVLNLMQPVGMGSSEFFGREDKAKNRVAEVWAVLP